MAGLEPEPWQADALDIMLGVRDHAGFRWACREYAEIVGRQEGKSIGIGIPRALFGLLGLRERLIIWSAHQYKTSLETFLQARDAMYRLGEEAGDNLIALELEDVLFVKVNNTNGEEGFELWDTPGGVLLGRWRFVARSAVSGRGFSGDCNIVDEGFAYTLLQRRAIAPTLLARPNPQTIYLSSPPLNGESGDVLYALAARAAKGARNLGFRDWGLALLLDDLAKMTAEQRAAFLDDPANLVAALPALGRGRVTGQAVQELREEFEGDDLGFASEVLCLWPRQTAAGKGWLVISEADWLARGGAAGRPEAGLAFALEASWPDAAMGAIGLAAGAGGELLVQIPVKDGVLDHRPGIDWMVSRAADLHRRWPAAAFVLDKGGPIGHLARPLEEAGVPMTYPSTADVAHAFGRFLAAVKDGTLRHYDQPVLDAAVKVAGTRQVRDGRMWARQQVDAGGDISPLTAVTLALGEAARRAKPAPAAPLSVPSRAGGARPATADLNRIGF